MYRQAEGCPALTFNQQLTNAAQGHAADMALNDFFGHQGSDGSSPWDRMARAGYRQAGAAENVAAGYPTPEEVVDGWMTSPGHRQNILNCEYRDIGIGYYYLEDDAGTHNYHSYWVQKFGTPAP